MKCPYCNSTNVEKTVYHYLKKGAAGVGGVLLSVGMGMLMGGNGRLSNSDAASGKQLAESCNDEYECNNCGREFTIDHS